MINSTNLHLNALLDMYIGPTPEVTEPVRKQLLQVEEAEKIRTAIEKKAKGDEDAQGLYSTWLSYSGLDFNNKPETLVSVVNRGILHRAMFDLMLGQRVKAYQLKRYSEVHKVRAWIEAFFIEFGTLISQTPDFNHLWWDEINPNETSHTDWISPRLRRDPDFVKVLESWLGDSEYLQSSLDRFMSQTKVSVSNNPKEPYPVISATTARGIIKFAEVRSPKGSPCDLQTNICASSVPGRCFRLATGRGFPENVDNACQRMQRARPLPNENASVLPTVFPRRP